MTLLARYTLLGNLHLLFFFIDVAIEGAHKVDDEKTPLTVVFHTKIVMEYV